MDIKKMIKSQYHSALRMLAESVEACPEELWNAPNDKNKFWHTAYHALFYTHFYLHVKEEDYAPWGKHRKEVVSLSPENWPDDIYVYPKAEIIEYVNFLSSQIDQLVDLLDLPGESGFHWKPCTKMEFQFEIIRHLQQHNGELADRIGENTNAHLNWVGRNY